MCLYGESNFCLATKYSIPNFAAYGGKEICLFNLSVQAEENNLQYLEISPSSSNHICKDWIMDVR